MQQQLLQQQQQQLHEEANKSINNTTQADLYVDAMCCYKKVQQKWREPQRYQIG